jgi:hypothetical protein
VAAHALPQEVRVVDERRADVVPRRAAAQDEVVDAGEELQRRPPVGAVAEDSVDTRVARELTRDPSVERRAELEPARPPQQ